MWKGWRTLKHSTNVLSWLLHSGVCMSLLHTYISLSFYVKFLIVLGRAKYSSWHLKAHPRDWKIQIIINYANQICKNGLWLMLWRKEMRHSNGEEWNIVVSKSLSVKVTFKLRPAEEEGVSHGEILGREDSTSKYFRWETTKCLWRADKSKTSRDGT